MLKTVKEMYESAVLKDTALLSTYNGDFWNEYIKNHKEYDRLFMRMFKSFIYFLQDGNESIDDVLTNFIEDVKLHLTVNSKKYSELYRTYIVTDDDYMLLDNYNVKETMNKQNSYEGSNVLGERNDVTNDTIGAITTNTSSTIGAITTNTKNTIGAITTNTTSTIGEQSNSEIKKVSPYDSNTFNNESGTDSSFGKRSDSGNTTTNEHIDSGNETTNEHTDSGNTTTNEHTDNLTFTKGQQTDSHSNNSTESYELTRKGNIGVQTGADMLRKHDSFWTPYEFYTMIFKDICKELLLVD